MNRRQLADGLHLDNHCPIDEQVDPVSEIDTDPIIKHRERKLILHEMPPLSKLMNEASFVDTFEQAWPECRVHLHGRVHHGTAGVIEFHLRRMGLQPFLASSFFTAEDAEDAE